MTIDVTQYSRQLFSSKANTIILLLNNPRSEKRSKSLCAKSYRGTQMRSTRLIKFVAFRLNPWRVTLRAEKINTQYTSQRSAYTCRAISLLSRSYLTYWRTASVHTYMRPHRHGKHGDTRNGCYGEHTYRRRRPHVPTPSHGHFGVTDGFVDKELSRLVFVDVA